MPKTKSAIESLARQLLAASNKQGIERILRQAIVDGFTVDNLLKATLWGKIAEQTNDETLKNDQIAA